MVFIYPNILLIRTPPGPNCVRITYYSYSGLREKNLLIKKKFHICNKCAQSIVEKALKVSRPNGK